jgi:hypothetical protein
MAKQLSKPSKKAGMKPGKKQNKNKLKQAALFYWSHSIYIGAHRAARAVGGFSNTPGAGSRFYCVVKKMKALIAELNEIADTEQCIDAEGERVQAQRAQRAQRRAAAPEGAESASAEGEYYCATDRECPDGQICIYGTCESPFA